MSKKITPEDIRTKMAEVGLSNVQVREATGMSASWFNKMIIKPVEGHKQKWHFHDPNPEWMRKIMKFLNSYAKLKDARAFRESAE